MPCFKVAVKAISSVLVWFSLFLFCKSSAMVFVIGFVDVKYGMNSGTSCFSAKMLTSESSFVFISHQPTVCHKMRLDWYIMTIGQPAAATWRVAEPLATIVKSDDCVISITESVV